MIKEIRIKNYKSINKLKLELGRVTVLIGENGCGKSNILEAIALGSAAASDKLDNEFLVSRGIRVTDSQLMRSAFEHEQLNRDIMVSFINKNEFTFNLSHDNQPYSIWKHSIDYSKTHFSGYINSFLKVNNLYQEINIREISVDMLKLLSRNFIQTNINDIINFLIFSPENKTLRIFEEEGQIQPLGINGEGLLKFLQFLNESQPQKIEQIKKHLKLIDWFADFEIPKSQEERKINLKDRYLAESLDYFTQKSSNEGFLFLLFYFALFISEITPQFFAIDNIDNSLNPRLCRRLIQELVKLAKENDKQVILTTHNPAVLDGLNLDDEEQRLYVISRNQLGYTKANRVTSPKPLEGQQPVRLSEAFLRGYIGGLPKNF
jgi:predicted ATPase